MNTEFVRDRTERRVKEDYMASKRLIDAMDQMIAALTELRAAIEAENIQKYYNLNLEQYADLMASFLT